MTSALDLEDPNPHLDLHAICVALLGEDHIHRVDAESIDQAGDYAPLLRALDRIADGALAIGQIRFREGPKRLVVFSRAHAPEVELILAGDTDWIDSDFLVQQLNTALDLEGRPERYHRYWSRDFGQETAFVFLDERTALQLRELVEVRKEFGIFEQIFPDGRRRAFRP